MAWLKTSNLGKTELVSDNGTTLEVQDTSVFPDISGTDDTFRVIVTDKDRNLTLSDIEIINVASVDPVNNLLTDLTRGLEGTTEKTWASGDIVEQRTTADYLDELHTGVDGKASDPHNNTAHSETYATTTGTYADLRAQSTTNDDVGLGNVNNVQQAESTHGINAPYEIQKDGTDGNGIINFKTS